jgi:hypothetical protein
MTAPHIAALSAADCARAVSWMPEIAVSSRPGSKITSSAGDIRIGSKGSLSIESSGLWYDFEAGAGDHGAITLVEHLHQCTPAEATALVYGFLRDHPGQGAHLAVDGVGAERQAGFNAAFAEKALSEKQPVAGTLAEIYLVSRCILGPYSDNLGFVPDARLGEHALIAEMVVNGPDGKLNVVGVQVGYLDAEGRKSMQPPPRRKFFSAGQDERQGAHFRITGTAPPPAPDGGTRDPGSPEALADVTFVCEGVEDALSVHTAYPHSTIIAALSVGNITRLPPITGKVIVIRDGDPADSQARRTLVKGVDHLVLGGAAVYVTPTGDGKDANSILQDGGVDALRELVAQAAPHKLSLDGEVTRLSGLPLVDYDRERKIIAKAHTMRVSSLDNMVDKVKRRAAPATTEDSDGDDTDFIWKDDAWSDPIDNMVEVLDNAKQQLKKNVHAANEHVYNISVIWALHTFFVHYPDIYLHISPRLSIEAVDAECGKTTLLEAISCLSCRPLPTSSISASAFFRVVDACKPTLFIDEAHTIFRSKGNEELAAILKASHRRNSAFTLRTEEKTSNNGRRKFRVRRYSTWCTFAYTSIGKAKDHGMQSRAVSVILPRAKPGEVREHLIDGTSPVLDECRRKFARFAADQHTMPRVPLPMALANRLGDNWRPLIEVAHLVGGNWPDMVMQAALAAIGAGASTPGGPSLALLTDIRTVIGSRSRIATKELLEGLLQLEEPSADWSMANRGRPINHYDLRSMLEGLLDPPGSQKWRIGNNREQRGYTYSQLQDAFFRYLRPLSVASIASVAGVGNQSSDNELGGDACLQSSPPQPNTHSSRAPSPHKSSDSATDVGFSATDCKSASVLEKVKCESTTFPITTDATDATDGQGGEGKANASQKPRALRKCRGVSGHPRIEVVSPQPDKTDKPRPRPDVLPDGSALL